MTEININKAAKRIGNTFLKSIVYSLFFSTLFFSLNAIFAFILQRKYFSFDLLSDGDGFQVSGDEFLFYEKNTQLFSIIFAIVILISTFYLIKIIKSKNESKSRYVILILSIVINFTAMILYMIVAIKGKAAILNYHGDFDTPIKIIIILPLLLFGSLFIGMISDNKIVNTIIHNVYLLTVTMINIYYSSCYIYHSLLCKRKSDIFLGEDFRYYYYKYNLPQVDDFIAFAIAAFFMFVICVSFINLIKNKFRTKMIISLIDLIFKIILLIINLLVWISIDYYIYDWYGVT